MSNYTLLRKVIECYTQKDLSSPEIVKTTLKTFLIIIFLTPTVSQLAPRGDKQTVCTCILMGLNRTGSFTSSSFLLHWFHIPNNRDMSEKGTFHGQWKAMNRNIFCYYG